ncbi:hypothetical protein P7K49_029729 [Saguinus oedipus]|uniref:Uncharacterized protein n=1 Tax=Saguinus oedipus TaxID=9490 RepID=A0ABQ9U809_SAGOE|nr:hypothetical protein P7K49_029729 [Saguinus oedipus]
MAGGDRDPETWEARKSEVVKGVRRDLRGELGQYHGDSHHHGGSQKIKWAETAEGSHRAKKLSLHDMQWACVVSGAADRPPLDTESIYYFVVGDVPEESKELLLQSALEIPYPVHTVSFNARGEGTIAFLKDLSAKTHSR